MFLVKRPRRAMMGVVDASATSMKPGNGRLRADRSLLPTLKRHSLTPRAARADSKQLAYDPFHFWNWAASSNISKALFPLEWPVGYRSSLSLRLGAGGF
jgi:hypothetical protein